MTALILALLNIIGPEVPTIIAIVKQKTGGISILTFLDEADVGFDLNIKQITDWQLAHPKVVKP